MQAAYSPADRQSALQNGHLARGSATHAKLAQINELALTSSLEFLHGRRLPTLCK
jgi:hypothetical protein